MTLSSIRRCAQRRDYPSYKHCSPVYHDAVDAVIFHDEARRESPFAEIGLVGFGRTAEGGYFLFDVAAGLQGIPTPRISAPAAARPMAIERPMPLLQPVTRAVFPERSKSAENFIRINRYCCSILPNIPSQLSKKRFIYAIVPDNDTAVFYVVFVHFIGS